MNNIIILGNGPSMRGFDFTLLNRIETIGMNVAYRYWQKINWYPTYYCCMDKKVIESHHQEIYDLIKKTNIKKYLLCDNFIDYHPDVKQDPKVMIYDKIKNHICFKSKRKDILTTGSMSIRFATYLGFTNIFLLGIDCQYIEIVEGAKQIDNKVLQIVKAPKSNPNYFFDDYQKIGDLYHKPREDQGLHTIALSILKEDYKQNMPNIKIVNCNKQSTIYKQKIFPFIELKQILN